ncbi:MAG: hypothetical protein V4616_00595 [Bacteroidota bacterium]
MSGYSAFVNNPLSVTDPDGKEIRMIFESDAARQAYVTMVNKSLPPGVTATLVRVEDPHGYSEKVILSCVETQATSTAKQDAFYEQYRNAVDNIARMNVVQDELRTVVGSFDSGKLDVNDIATYDEAGQEGDYYSQRGIKVGTDGIDDGRNYVVGDDKEARSIQKSGGQVEQGSVKSAVELPSAAVRSEMQQVVGMDKAMPFQEHGGIFGRTEGGAEKVVMAESGGVTQPGVEGSHARINPFTAANADEQGSLSNVVGTFHTHPSATTGTKSDPFAGSVISNTPFKGFDQTPSTIDITNAGTRASLGLVQGNSYVFGMRSNQVSIYNGSGVVGTIPMSTFFSIGR